MELVADRTVCPLSNLWPSPLLPGNEEGRVVGVDEGFELSSGSSLEVFGVFLESDSCHEQLGSESRSSHIAYGVALQSCALSVTFLMIWPFLVLWPETRDPGDCALTCASVIMTLSG